MTDLTFDPEAPELLGKIEPPTHVGAADRVNESKSGKLRSRSDLAIMYSEVLEKRQARDPNYIGIPTGIIDSRYLAYRRGDLWLVVSATGVGKTAFLMSLQGYLDRSGVPSLFISAEQPWVQIMDRALAAMTGLDSWRIAQGDLDEADWRTVNQALANFADYPGYLIDGSLSTAEVALIVKSIKTRDIRIIFLDYAQHLTDRKGDTEYARVTYISNELARIALDMDVCIVAGAQVSKQGEGRDGKPPLLAEIRESGHLGQDAAVVIAIGRKEGESAAQVALRKNRHALSGLVLPFYFDAEHARFLPRISQAQSALKPTPPPAPPGPPPPAEETEIPW